jgi:hypothetical protein
MPSKALLHADCTRLHRRDAGACDDRRQPPRTGPLGAFIAAPGAPEAVGEAVFAIKARTPLDLLADAIHPFPTTVRVMGGMFAQVARRLERTGSA